MVSAVTQQKHYFLHNLVICESAPKIFHFVQVEMLLIRSATYPNVDLSNHVFLASSLFFSVMCFIYFLSLCICKKCNL